jgi:hypothetical protein
MASAVSPAAVRFSRSGFEAQPEVLADDLGRVVHLLQPLPLASGAEAGPEIEGTADLHAAQTDAGQGPG